MYNNYNNDNFNNDPKPLFSNEFPGVEVNNNVVNNSNNFVNTAQDIPPVLEPIKNLNEASVVNAPTLDNLSPMNIMPESFENTKPVNIDPLDAYDNGINYEPQVNLSTENNFLNTSTSYGEMQNISNNFEWAPTSFEIPKDESNFSQNSIGFETPNLGNYENSEFSTKIPINENVIDNFSSEPIVNSSEEKSFEVSLNENNSYEIMQDKIEKENRMVSLDSADAYDDVDMLDIVDIDEEKKEEIAITGENDSSKEDTRLEEQPLIADNITEIKELINKIKEKGIKIELEEFDFEHMYQLIVKIEK